MLAWNGCKRLKADKVIGEMATSSYTRRVDSTVRCGNSMASQISAVSRTHKPFAWPVVISNSASSRMSLTSSSGSTVFDPSQRLLQQVKPSKTKDQHQPSKCCTCHQQCTDAEEGGGA